MLKCISLIGLMIHAFAFGLAQADFRKSYWYSDTKRDEVVIKLKINLSFIQIQQQRSNQFLMAMDQVFTHFNGLFILKAILDFPK